MSFESRHVLVLSFLCLVVGCAKGNNDRLVTGEDSQNPSPVQPSHQGPVTLATLSQDGKILASGSADGLIRCWAIPSGKEFEQLETGVASAIAIDPDGRLVASADLSGEIRLWEIATGKEAGRFRLNKSGAALAMLWKKNLLVALADPSHVELWNATKKTLRQQWFLQDHQLAVGSFFTSVTFSSDGLRLAAGNYDRLVYLWDAKTGATVDQLRGHVFDVTCIAFSNDGGMLASGGRDNTVQIWDTATGRRLQELLGRQGDVWSVTFSPDGKRLASGGADKTIILWDVQTGTVVRRWVGHEDRINALIFTPDNQVIISASSDQTVRLWQASAGKLIRQLEGRPSPRAGIRRERKGLAGGTVVHTAPAGKK